MKQNDELAAQWLEKSAELDNPYAQMSLGLMYLNGQGFALNNNNAAEYLSASTQVNM